MAEPRTNDYVSGTDSDVAEANAVMRSGWVEDSTNTWTYSSADSPTFVASVNADMTATISAGMRVRLTQTTVKYFIVTAVGSYSGGATSITLYGGTDYTLADAAISSPGWSSFKAPFGFPLNPDKWTVEVVSSGTRETSSPVAGTWYNAESINIPIGVWVVSYSACISGETSGAQYSWGSYSTLSTGSSSESNTHLTDMFAFATYNTIFLPSTNVRGNDVISLSVKTTYYLNYKIYYAVDKVGIYGLLLPTIIRAVSAYL